MGWELWVSCSIGLGHWNSQATPRVSGRTGPLAALCLPGLPVLPSDKLANPDSCPYIQVTDGSPWPSPSLLMGWCCPCERLGWHWMWALLPQLMGMRELPWTPSAVAWQPWQPHRRMSDLEGAAEGHLRSGLPGSVHPRLPGVCLWIAPLNGHSPQQGPAGHKGHVPALLGLASSQAPVSPSHGRTSPEPSAPQGLV